MRIAVTGATGFIGRHVLAALQKLDETALRGEPLEIIATTRGSGGEPAHLPRVRWATLDLESPPDDPLRHLSFPDVLVHLAWGGLPNYHSARHVEVELPLHEGFLGRIIRDGLKAVVVAGTCFEYGMQEGLLSEACPPRPANPYASAKDRLRRFLEDLQDRHQFQLTWLRFFYLYGSGQPGRTLYTQLLQAIGRGDPAFDMSGGEQVRDYLPVTEAADIVASLALRAGGAGVVNICSGLPCTVKSLVEGWVAEADASIRLNLGHYPYSEYEPMQFWGSNEKLRSLLETP
jgi:nucleoside-diphosphate-sugar epimerase